MPFRSVYNRVVGRCYELHCDKALCKPSLSIRLSSVCLWFVVAYVFLCDDSFPSAHSAHCVSIFGFRVSLGKGCHSCFASGSKDCCDSEVCCHAVLHLLKFILITAQRTNTLKQTTLQWTKNADFIEAQFPWSLWEEPSHSHSTQ